MAASRGKALKKGKEAVASIVLITVFVIPLFPGFALLSPAHRPLLCLCCSQVEQPCSFRCACGCDEKGAFDDFGWTFEATPVYHELAVFLSLSIRVSPLYDELKSVCATVPTHPPELS